MEVAAATKVKPEFLPNMSHEIRTPMKAIIGISHIALKTNLDLRQKGHAARFNGRANTSLESSTIF